MALVLAAAMVPALLVGLGFIGYDYFDRERARLIRDSFAITRALSAAVDSDLAVTRAALLALATSPYLTRADLAAFHAQALGTAREQGFANIILTDSNGRQLLNTFRRFGEALPTQGDPGGLLRTFETQAPVVSDLFTGRLTKASIIGVGVPVKRDGKILYGLNAGVAPERLSVLLATQKLPERWITGVFDRQGTIVARTHDAARLVGQKGSPELVRRMREAAEGSFEGQTVEGTAVLTVFSRSPDTGWTVAIGIPMVELTQQLLSSLARLFVAGFVTLATALALGVLLARQLMRLPGD